MNDASEVICISSSDDEVTLIDTNNSQKPKLNSDNAINVNKSWNQNEDNTTKISSKVLPYCISKEKSRNISIDGKKSNSDVIKYNLSIVSTPKVLLINKSESNGFKYIPFITNYNTNIRKSQVLEPSCISSDSGISIETCKKLENTDSKKRKHDIDSSDMNETRLKLSNNSSAIKSQIPQCQDKISNSPFDINRVKKECLRDFLYECVSSKINTADVDAIKPRLKTLYRNFKHLNEWFADSDNLKSQLIEYRNQIENNPQHVMQYFNLVFDLFESKISQGGKENEIDRCVYIMENLKEKIKQLEETEVDFNEEHNSVYIQESFYKNKFCKVYKRWCKLIGQSYHLNRTIYQTIEYTQSKYAEFNNAINETFRKKCKFPNFDLIDSVLRKCIETHKMKIPLSDLEMEINKAFRTIGNIFQRRRIHETNDSLFYFLGSRPDPANEDELLNKKLKNYSKEAKEKLEAVFDYYTQKQYQMANDNENDCDNNGTDDEEEDRDSDSSNNIQESDNDVNSNLEVSNSSMINSYDSDTITLD